MCFSTSVASAEIMVVDYEIGADSGVFDNLDKVELLFTLKSVYKAEYYLKKKFADAEVQEVYALGRDRFLVQVDRGEENV